MCIPNPKTLLLDANQPSGTYVARGGRWWPLSSPPPPRSPHSEKINNYTVIVCTVSAIRNSNPNISKNINWTSIPLKRAGQRWLMRTKYGIYINLGMFAIILGLGGLIIYIQPHALSASPRLPPPPPKKRPTLMQCKTTFSLPEPHTHTLSLFAISQYQLE